MRNYIFGMLILLLFVLLIGHIADYVNHRHTPDHKYGDEVCLMGYGMTQGMPFPAPMVLCGELAPRDDPEAAPQPGEHSLENESRRGA